MASYINTNYTSLQAQYNLTQSQAGLSQSINRLSSGLRINTAADDAAGLAISDRMTAQINGLNQAGRNANDGISLVQTADGALSSIAADLQRMRQLASQSATGTLSSADRVSINQEAQNLLSEINRVSSATNFNGVSLLDGSFSNKNFQVGASAGQSISMTLNSANSASLGAYRLAGDSNFVADTSGPATVSTTAYSSTNYLTITTANTTSTGVQIGASVSSNPATNSSLGLSSGSAYAKAAAINAQTSLTGVSATAKTTYGGASYSTSTPTISPGTITASTALAAGDLTINGVSIGAALGDSNTVTQSSNIATSINAVSSSTGVTASVDSSSGAIQLTAADGRDIKVVSTTNGANASGLMSAAGTVTQGGYLSLTSSVNFAVTEGGTSPTALADSGLSVNGTVLGETFSGINNLDLTTQDDAITGLTTLDAAIQQVDTQRGNLGAIQNRFQLTVSNLQQTSINLTSSRSRIRDTDFAAETANLSQSQILQQAGTAMLTQANTLPNSVLALLKG